MTTIATQQGIEMIDTKTLATALAVLEWADKLPFDKRCPIDLMSRVDAAINLKICLNNIKVEVSHEGE